MSRSDHKPLLFQPRHEFLHPIARHGRPVEPEVSALRDPPVQQRRLKFLQPRRQIGQIGFRRERQISPLAGEIYAHVPDARRSAEGFFDMADAGSAGPAADLESHLTPLGTRLGEFTRGNLCHGRVYGLLRRRIQRLSTGLAILRCGVRPIQRPS